MGPHTHQTLDGPLRSQETRAARCVEVTGLSNASGRQVHARCLGHLQDICPHSLGTLALGATGPHDGRVLEA